MPRYMIERKFAERLDVTKDAANAIVRINDEEGVKWLFSFLSADKMRTYCLYEAPNAEAIRIAARRCNLPADAIIEIDSEVRPEMFALRSSRRRHDPEETFRRHALFGSLTDAGRSHLLRHLRLRSAAVG